MTRGRGRLLGAAVPQEGPENLGLRCIEICLSIWDHKESQTSREGMKDAGGISGTWIFAVEYLVYWV